MNTDDTGSIFIALLTVLFIGLKLTGYVAWSWWWVLAPLWAPFPIALIIMLIVVIFGWAVGR